MGWLGSLGSALELVSEPLFCVRCGHCGHGRYTSVNRARSEIFSRSSAKRLTAWVLLAFVLVGAYGLLFNKSLSDLLGIAVMLFILGPLYEVFLRRFPVCTRCGSAELISEATAREKGLIGESQGPRGSQG